KAGCALNIFGSTSKPFGTTPRALSILLMIIIPNTHRPKTIAIRSIKGISYTPCALGTAKLIADKKCKSMSCPENFKITENTKPPNIRKITVLKVVYFQNKPIHNTQQSPVYTKPVYSCLY